MSRKHAVSANQYALLEITSSLSAATHVSFRPNMEALNSNSSNKISFLVSFKYNFTS